jgi:hypothetical protein
LFTQGKKSVDPRLLGILKSLLLNIDVLDGQILSLLRSEQFRANDECMLLITRIRESCTATLQCVDGLERAARNNAFVIPPNVMASLE